MDPNMLLLYHHIWLFVFPLLLLQKLVDRRLHLDVGVDVLETRQTFKIDNFARILIISRFSIISIDVCDLIQIEL